MLYNHIMKGGRRLSSKVRHFASTTNPAQVFADVHRNVRAFGSTANKIHGHAEYINNNILGGALYESPTYVKGTEVLKTLGKLNDL